MHAFFEAVQGAIDAHGLPEELDYLHVGTMAGDTYISVKLVGAAAGQSGKGKTIAEAVERCEAMIAEEAQLARGASAAKRLRELAAANGISPSLVMVG